MDLTPRTLEGPSALEKWYVDTLLDDGRVLIIYAGSVCLFGYTWSTVTADLFTPDGLDVHGSARPQNPVGGRGHLRLGRAFRIVGRTLFFETDMLSGRLRFHPRADRFVVGDPLIERAGQRLEWTVEVPDAEVRGEIRSPMGSMAIAGRGYRDRVFFDMPAWRFPISELRWGRAVAGPHWATWLDVTTDEERTRRAWVNGREAPLDGHLPPAVRLEDERTFVDTDVISLKGFVAPLLQPVARAVSGNPHETKYACAARVDGEAGRAVHEVVRWR